MYVAVICKGEEGRCGCRHDEYVGKEKLALGFGGGRGRGRGATSDWGRLTKYLVKDL